MIVFEIIQIFPTILFLRRVFSDEIVLKLYSRRYWFDAKSWFIQVDIIDSGKKTWTTEETLLAITSLVIFSFLTIKLGSIFIGKSDFVIAGICFQWIYIYRLPILNFQPFCRNIQLLLNFWISGHFTYHPSNYDWDFFLSFFKSNPLQYLCGVFVQTNCSFFISSTVVPIIHVLSKSFLHNMILVSFFANSTYLKPTIFVC